MPWATVPQCEACWFEEHTVKVDDEEMFVAPLILNDHTIRICYSCNKPTVAGIFVRGEVTPEQKAYYEQ